MSRSTKWWDSTNGMCGASILNGVDEQTALTKLAALEDILCPADAPEITLDELREMVQAKREGRIAILPLAVGSSIWTKEPFPDGKLREGIISVISIDDEKAYSFWCNFENLAGCAEFIFEDIGTTVFLSLEDALAKKGEKQ